MMPPQRRQARAGPLGLAVLTLIALTAALAPLLSPLDPMEQDITRRLLPPVWLGGVPEYPLGTDGVGRDVLSRLIYGSRVSLLVGLSTTALAGLVGVSLGLAAGYFGGGVDALLSRLSDVQQAVPFLVLALAVVALVKPGLLNLIAVLTVTTWVNYFRVIRGAVLAAREEEYVWAARALGCGDARLILRHILPNVAGPAVVVATLLMANVIIFEASLSFLGLGVPRSLPTWGRSVADGRDYLVSAWWIALFPGLAIMTTVAAINLLGDWLRDRLNPWRRR